MAEKEKASEIGKEYTEVQLNADTKVHNLKAKRDEVDLDIVYKKLAVINGEINKMSREELKDKLAELRLDTRGIKEVLKKRLKSHYRQRKLMKAKVKPPGGTSNDYLLVIDFEATCEENNANYKHEIIEFPVVLIDAHRMEVVDEFHSYCKPKVNPRLSKFCTTLTGITQSMVDSAEHFATVLKKMESWMESHHLGSDHKFAVVTDGPWDMSRFLSMQCYQDGITFPKWGKKWVNVGKSYSNFYQCRRVKLENMLISMGMKFEGNLHCGLHDSRNIARIVIRLLQDGCSINVNEFIHFDKVSAKTADSSEYKDDDVKSDNESSDLLLEVNEKSEAIKSKDKNSVTRKEKSCDQDINQSMEKLSLQEDDEVNDLLEYYRLQNS